MLLYVMLVCGSGRRGEIDPVAGCDKLKGRSGTQICLTVCYDTLLCDSGRVEIDPVTGWNKPEGRSGTQICLAG